MLLMLGVVISTSTMSILSPMLVIFFSSEYFIVLAVSVEFVLIFALIYAKINKTRKISNFDKSKFLLVLQLSVFNAYTTLAMVYSSHPSKTPPLMQSTLTGLAILPSTFFRKIFFGINTVYDMKYIYVSCFFLLTSVILSAIPMLGEGSAESIGWSLLYFSGICTKSYYSGIQEVFIKQTEKSDSTQSEKLENRVALSYYSRILMLLIILPFFACEWIGNKEHNPTKSFAESFLDAFTLKKGFLLQGFIISYFCMFFMSVYVNAISTNYNMILSSASVPSVALFYTIIPGMTYGMDYPIWITVLSLVSIILSIYFWTKGDTQKVESDDNYYLFERNSCAGISYEVTINNVLHSSEKGSIHV